MYALMAVAAAGALEDLRAASEVLNGLEGETSVEAIPAWALQEAPAAPNATSEALVAALSAPEPSVRALAIRQLENSRCFLCVSGLADLLDDSASARFPVLQEGPVAESEPTVAWSDLTIGQTASQAIDVLIGESHSSSESWNQRRTATGSLERSVSVWNHRLPRGFDDPGSMLAMLPPWVSVRVRLSRSDLYGWSEAELRQEWDAEVGRDRTDELLQQGLDEPGLHSDFPRFASWVFPSANFEMLKKMWETEPTRWSRSALALALADVDPTGADHYLLTVLKEGGAEPEVVARLVEDPDPNRAALAAALPDLAPESQVALFEAIGAHGRKGREALRTILGDTVPWSPRAIEALNSAARAMGVRVKLPMLDAIESPRPFEGSSSDPKFQAEQRRAEDARKDCVRRIREAL